MASKFVAVFAILVSFLLSSHGLYEILETCMKNNHVRDQATVTFVNKLHAEKVTILAKSLECWNCPMVKEKTIKSQSNVSLNFSTNFQIEVCIEGNKDVVCNLTLKLQEKNEYAIYLNEFPCNVTSLCTDLPDPNCAVYWLVGLLIAFVIAWETCLLLKRNGAVTSLKKFKSNILKRTRILFIKSSDESDVGSQDSTTDLIQADLGIIETSAKKSRIHSIDAFRGFSLALMIFVNYGGGGYWYFHHSIWDGVTAADLVFPWFVFVMGLTVGVTFHSRSRKENFGPWEKLLAVLRRSVILFVLGLVLSNKNRTLFNLRIPGVLQRLAVTYLVVGVVETFEIPSIPMYNSKACSLLRDILPFWKSWIAALACVMVHSCLTFFLPVPGCPSGYLGAGGLQDFGKFENCTGGAAGYIDRVVFGREHIYQHPTCSKMYKTKVPFDPEGILGTLTSIVLCFFGVQAGRIMVAYGPVGKTTRWFIWACILGTAGGALCGFKKFGGFIPLNKNLWSLSLVFVTSGMAFGLLSVFYILIECLAVWSGAPFIYLGMNSIAIYLCSELFEDYFPVHLLNPDSHAGLTAVHAWGVLVWIFVSVLMYYKNIFISI